MCHPKGRLCFYVALSYFSAQLPSGLSTVLQFPESELLSLMMIALNFLETLMSKVCFQVFDNSFLSRLSLMWSHTATFLLIYWEPLSS